MKNPGLASAWRRIQEGIGYHALNIEPGSAVLALERESGVRNSVLALLISVAGATPVSAQVRCFNECFTPMIDYGRALAKDYASDEWHPAQITESTVTWQDDQHGGALTRYFSFDRYTGHVTEKMIHHPPYTNPPYYGQSQCREVKCPVPRY
jgi:hypothetical protein